MLKKSKKFVSVLLIVVMLVLCVPVFVSAADTAPPQVSFNIPVGIEAANNRTVTNDQSFLAYITAYDDTGINSMNLRLKNENDQYTTIPVTYRFSINGAYYYTAEINLPSISGDADYELILKAYDSNYNLSTTSYYLSYTSKELYVDHDLKKSYTPPFWGGPFRVTGTVYDLEGAGIERCYVSICKPGVPVTFYGEDISINYIRPGVYECSGTVNTDVVGNAPGQYGVRVDVYNSNGRRDLVDDRKVTINPPVVYRNQYFSDGKCLDVGDYKLADLLKIGVRNDDISSLRVPAGYKVTVYKHDNFVTPNYFTRDCGALSSSWDNQISSIKVSTIPSVYTQAGYQGQSAGLDVGQYTASSLRNLGINDNDISAIICPSSYTITVYSDDNFQGESKVIRGCSYNYDISRINWDNKISSIKVTAN